MTGVGLGSVTRLYATWVRRQSPTIRPPSGTRLEGFGQQDAFDKLSIFSIGACNGQTTPIRGDAHFRGTESAGLATMASQMYIRF
jgi:hypothetical protein